MPPQSIDVDDYDRLCRNLYNELDEKMERKGDERAKFARRGTAKNVLNDDNLKRFYRSLSLNDQAAQDQPEIAEHEFLTNVSKWELHDFLAILVPCRKEAARAAVIKLWSDLPTWVESPKLPMKKDFLRELFSHGADVDNFFERQKYFCPVVLRNGGNPTIDPLTQRLPFLEEEELHKRGANSKLFRVVVAPGHYEAAQPGFTSNTEELVMVHKKVSSPEAKMESKAISSIRDSVPRSHSLQPRNIVDILGSFELTDGSYSLFMPMAECDLRTYMMERNKHPPAKVDQKAKLIDCAAGLAGGLAYLHHGMCSADDREMTCWHLDLKPDNVLIFEEKYGPVWKICDFGLSCVKTSHSNSQGNGPEGSFNPQSFSATAAKRGEGTYLSPEFVPQGRNVTLKSDVWSLGCIISVLFVYLEDGENGVKDYGDKRREHTVRMGVEASDRFFIKEPIKLHPKVVGRHRTLINAAKSRNQDEGLVVEEILNELVSGPLNTNSKQRYEAKKVEDMLTNAHRRYSRIAPSYTPKPPSFVRRFIESRFGRHHPQTETDKMQNAKLSRWEIASRESFRGCTISPDGSLVACWTDRLILLCTRDSLHRAGNDRFSSKRELKDRGTVWQSISLTKEHLLASTTSSNCYIFDLTSSHAEEYGLNEEPRKVCLHENLEVQKFAISPDGRKLAFVLSWKGDYTRPGILIRPSFKGLMGQDETQQTTGSGPQNRCSELELDDPAQNFDYISISDDGSVHLVKRPKPTAKYEIQVLQIPTSGDHRGRQLTFRPQGFDSSNKARPFTDFIHFRGSPDGPPGREDSNPKAAVVMYEKKLLIQSFKKSMHDRQIDIKQYRVLKLLVERNAVGRLYALGTREADKRIRLLKLNIDGYLGRHLSIEEVSRLDDLLDDHEYEARLVERNGESFVLVVVPGSLRSVYEVPLAPRRQGGS